MREIDVLDNMVELWVERVAPHVKRSCCVLAARTASLVLDYYGHTNKVLACDALIINTEAVALMRANVPVAEWPLPAWSIGVTDQSPGNGVSAHLVVLTGTGNLVDLSAAQFNRPGLIEIDGPRVWQPVNIDNELIINDGNTWVFLQPKQGTRYKHGIDWRTRGREIAARIIRTINTKEKDQPR